MNTNHPKKCSSGAWLRGEKKTTVYATLPNSNWLLFLLVTVMQLHCRLIGMEHKESGHYLLRLSLVLRSH